MPAASHHRLITLGRLTLLDPVGNEDRELGTRKRKLALLTVLAVSGRSWTRDALVDLFWGEQDEARARHSLSDTLSHLRRVLGPDAISQRRTEVALAEDIALGVDVLELQDAARQQRWVDVVTLYGGPFLDGLHVGGSPRLEQWMDGERRRLDALFATAARAQCEVLLRAGEYDACAELASRWLRVAPTSPHAALFRLRALAAPGTPEGDQQALDEHAAIARQLESEYAARPDRVVMALVEEISTRVRARQVDPMPVVVSSASAEAEAVPAVVAVAPTLPVADAPVGIVAPRASRRWPWFLVLGGAAAAAFAWTQSSRGPEASNQAAPVILTASPAARALYEQGVMAYDRDGNRDEAIRLLDSAIAIDSTFAQAYRRLGQIYDNGVDGRSRSVEMLTLAARHAAQLPETERLVTLGAYHRTVTGNFARAASSYRALLEIAPNDARAWSSLGTVYDHLGDRRRAVEAYERSIAINPRQALTWMNLADGRYTLGDSAGAWRTLDSMALAFPGHPGLFMRTASLAHAEDKRELAEGQLRALITSAGDDGYQRAVGEMLLAKAWWSWGRLDEGDAARMRGVRLERARGAREAALVGELDLAMAAVWLRGDSTLARKRIADALRTTPLASLRVEDRPYLDASIALASSGQPAPASALLDEYLLRSDSLTRRRDATREHHARGMIAMASHQWPIAIAEFRMVSDALCPICGMPELALVYEQAGLRDSALAVVRRYRTTPSQRRLDMTAAFHSTGMRARWP